MRTLLVISALGMLAAPAGAASLRPMTTLTGPTVKLSDLFDDAGPNAARVLGPAPALGGRVIVEAAQLAAIARQFGVKWQPGSLAERVVLDRPGKPLAREQVQAPLHAALVAAGAPSDCEIEMPAYAPPLVPYAGAAEPVVSQVEYDAASGRFAAVLSITGDNTDPINTRLVGRVEEMLSVPVAATRLQAGAVLAAGDVRMVRMRASLLHAEIARDPGQIAGMALRRQASAGQPLPLADLMRPPLVQKGDAVEMLLESPGLRLVGQAQAMESGALGERIRVLNTVSRAVLEAEVTGPERVRVQPDSSPVIAAGRTRLAATDGLGGGR